MNIHIYIYMYVCMYVNVKIQRYIYLHKIDVWMGHALERRLHVVILYLAFFSPYLRPDVWSFAFPRCFNDR